MKNKGITLISLVITIIILIILAGVGINLSLGENGIFRRAKEARDKYLASAQNEQEALNELYKELGMIDLPENTPTTEAGTEVKLPDKWTTTPAYVSTQDGSIVKKIAKISNVIAVATGNGETVPVPKGFYYVGGTIATGVVISDDQRDQNKYVNFKPTEGGEVQEGVPTGVTYNEDGTVNEEASELKGNQFVWIPCTAENYKKVTTFKNGSDDNAWNATWEKQTHGTEIPQIQKYEGFYIGRYEAGTSNINLSTKIDFSAQNTADSWRNDNFSIRDELNHTASGKITLKAGEVPYYHADYETALKLSNNMYTTEYVQSVLTTGTMWDAVMKFISTESDYSDLKSTSWGNYNNGVVTYIEGKGRYATVNSTTGAMTSSFIKSDGTYYSGIKTTGISESVKKKNLYDIAGNLLEWTQEAAYPNNTVEAYMVRGGSFSNSCSDRPACYRASLTAADTYTRLGFRPALYIK